MALFAKGDDLKRVPWFSLSEWHRVYNEIYSNDTKLQTKGYETLLVWKCRMPKLPVGVECTLSLIQVCLRDREWIPKINNGELPIYYENDLCLMYSTTLMRFLNQISNIGPTKQTSLFQIAKQLKIPEWIVHLRHDAAHGHELPAIGILRMAANILLAWLHDEYWKAESQAQFTDRDEVIIVDEIESPEELIDIIELWMSVGLYIEADFQIVADLPDEHLRNTLKDLYISVKTSKSDSNTSVTSDSFDDKLYRLTTARSYLLAEIYKIIRRNRNENATEKVVIDLLLNSEVFLSTFEFMKLFLRKSSDESYKGAHLPKAMIVFWQPFILMLHEMKILESLTKSLVQIVNSKNENKQRKKSAALWLKSIGQSYLKLKIARKESQALEYKQNQIKKPTQKILNQKLQAVVNSKCPELKHSFWLGINLDVPEMFLDDECASEILLNANEYTSMFISPFLDLITPEIKEETKENLLQLLSIQTGGRIVDDDDNSRDVIHTVDDLKSILGEETISKQVSNNQNPPEEELNLADKTIRNSNWALAPDNFNWGDCAFGVLPWQNSMEALVTEENAPRISCPVTNYDITPGFIDNSKLLTGKRVNWENVLRKNQRGRRKSTKREADAVMDKAIEIVKIRKI